MFDCGGMAFSEAGFHASICDTKVTDSKCTTTVKALLSKLDNCSPQA
jgi:hypothetical protein